MPHLAWGKSVRAGPVDVETTVWMMMVLKSAKEAGGLRLPGGAMANARAVLEGLTDETGLVEDPGRPGEVWMTPAAMLARIFAGEDPRKSVAILKGAEVCLKNLPEWKGGAIDMRHWYFGSLALFQIGGEPWKAWNAALKTAIIDHQRKSGDERGSWDPAGRWGAEGGRVFATAMMTMSLEVYYRYSRVFGTR
jgi:hypothetical protein